MHKIEILTFIILKILILYSVYLSAPFPVYKVVPRPELDRSVFDGHGYLRFEERGAHERPRPCRRPLVAVDAHADKEQAPVPCAPACRLRQASGESLPVSVSRSLGLCLCEHKASQPI